MKKKAKKIKVNGVIINDVLFYYKDSYDFMEAWPGIKLWLEVERENQKRGK